MTNLRKLVSGGLVSSGYVRDGRSHLRPIRPGVFSVVDTGPLDSRGDIAPWVGLRHDQVQELVTRCLELPNDPPVATVGSNVGYVQGGEYRFWMGDGDVDEVFREIDRARAVLTPFVDLERLPDAWKIRGTETPGYRDTLAVVHHLLGNHQELEHWLIEAEKADCRRDDELCEQFKRFKKNLLALPRVSAP